MRKLVTVSLFLLAPLRGQAQFSEACEASPAVQQDLKRLDIPEEIPVAKRRAMKKALFDELFAKYPDDFFVHMQYILTTRNQAYSDRSALTARYAQLAAAHPGSERFAFLNASALVEVDTPRAIGILGRQTSNPWAHLELAGIYDWGKFKDVPRGRAELRAFFSACPESWDNKSWNSLSRVADASMAGEFAEKFRRELTADENTGHFVRWSRVWNLEFKAKPVTQHQEVRKQVAADIVRLTELHKQPDDAKWLAFLKDGYKLAGDPDAVRKTEDALLTRFPDSNESRDIESERWRKAHPWPGADASDETKQAFYQAQLKRADERLKRKSAGTMAQWERFEALTSLDSSTASQIDAAADMLINAVGLNEDFRMDPPVEFAVARAYLKKKTRLAAVPSLVVAGWKRHQLEYRSLPDTYPDEFVKMEAEDDEYINLQRAEILLDAARLLGNPGLAKAAVAEALAAPKPKRPEDLWIIQAKWADLKGRKLDALLFYRGVLDARPAKFKPPKDDEIAASVARLRKELGGTPESQELWDKKGPTPELAEDGRWETPTKDMPRWELSDLQGKTWKLASLEGKTILINVWATWCGPCQSEQPHLEKLYQKLKDRIDIQIVTFNVDDEIGLVGPYMKEKGYTFPVLLAGDYVKALLPALSIPRNWIVDGKSKWRLEQIGFGGEQGWEEAMNEKLASVK